MGPWVDWYKHNGANGIGIEPWQTREGTQHQAPVKREDGLLTGVSKGGALTKNPESTHSSMVDKSPCNPGPHCWLLKSTPMLKLTRNSSSTNQDPMGSQD